MASENFIQNFIHQLEEGRWVRRVQFAALVAVCIAGFATFILDPLYWGLFRGLSHPKGMEAAEIAREVARGNGFSTKLIRPLELAQLKDHGIAIPSGSFPETYQAPLWPATLAPFLKLVEKRWEMTPKELTYVGDRMVAGVALVFFFLAAIVNYFTIRRLFDHKLAIMTVGLLLVCNAFWEFSLSGLPQMEMLLLFSGAIYTLVRAVENRLDGKSPMGWLVASAAIFGLLALTHAITVWAFIGALFFCVCYFPGRWRVVLSMLAVFAVIYSPWLVRNYQVCGNPLGTSGYSIFYQVRGSEGEVMRTSDLKEFKVAPVVFRNKIQGGISSQFGNIYALLGGILVAPVFFVSLMHLFKRSGVAGVRWLLLSMWLFAVFGMALFGSDDSGSEVSANNLHILFVPMFAAYGLAFVLVLWTRLEIRIVLLRRTFLTAIYVISALPLVNTFTGGNRGIFQWPPYAPPYIAILREWTEPQEVIASDVPWAVAWYADRKSLWLPAKVQDFLKLHDSEFPVSSPFAGIYLTPMSADKEVINEILQGKSKGWAPFILHSGRLKDFPFNVATKLPINDQCIFYSDRDRSAKMR